MATTQQRSRSRSVPPSFHPEDFVSARQYDRDWDDLKNMMQDIQKSIKELVPREEHERIWQANEARFSRLETKLDISIDETAKAYTTRREFEDRVTRIEGGMGRLAPWLGLCVAILGLVVQGGADAIAGVVFLILHLNGG